MFKIVKKILNKKVVVFFIVLVILFFAKTFIFSKKKSFDEKRLDLETVTIGNVNKSVNAVGIINPVNIVEVGAQVTGRVEDIFVDYNSVVKKGDILARIDQDVLEKEVREFEAQLNQRDFNLKLKKVNLERIKTLYSNNFIAKVELENAENELNLANESYKIAKLQYDKAKINLAYTYIKSPLSGTVISREVDKGQTVAAGLSAPTLFKIAEDLTKMQILTSISEADISSIKVGQKVSFSVDTYRDELFYGVVKEIRLQAAVEFNVVVYNVVIDIDNSRNLFLPGMTAYVNIMIDNAKDVLRIRNTVFRFKPNAKILKILDLENIFEKDPSLKETLSENKQLSIVYKFNNGVITPIIIEKGIHDTHYTEIRSDELKADDLVVSGYMLPKKDKK